MTDHKHINVRLEGPALALAQDITATCATAREKVEALQRDFERQAEKIREETNRELKALWPQLHLAAGVPVGEVGEWELDASYLEDHGVAFLSKSCREGEEGGLADFLRALGGGTGLKH